MSQNAGNGGSAPAAGQSTTAHPTGVIGTIVNFFRGKGLSDAAIAGILGNMRVESGFRTGALNSGENAIGLIQWEGGRRTALQNFAKQQGTSETDLNTQLNFIWHELNTSYTGVLSSLRNASNAADAAAVWDAQYEVSAGTTRAARVASANAFSASHLSSDGGAAGSADSSAGTGGGSGQYGGSGTSTPLTAAQYEQALGSMSGVFNAVPELKSLVDNAIATHQTTNDFINSFQNSNWYKTHNATWRSAFALKYSDPAEYQKQSAASLNRVQTAARAMGVTLDATTANQLAQYAFYYGLDDQQIGQHIASRFTLGTGAASGQAAQIEQQLKQLSALYGVPVTDNWVQTFTKNILEGVQTIDGARDNLTVHAKSLYPSLTKQLDAGQTTSDVAQPYIAQMAQTLEIAPNQVTLQDPTIKKALQFRPLDPKTGTATDPQLQPLWQFENGLRQDPRWDKTNNAQQEAYGMLHQLGQSFGFAS